MSLPMGRPTMLNPNYFCFLLFWIFFPRTVFDFFFFTRLNTLSLPYCLPVYCYTKLFVRGVNPTKIYHAVGARLKNAFKELGGGGFR